MFSLRSAYVSTWYNYCGHCVYHEPFSIFGAMAAHCVQKCSSNQTLDPDYKELCSRNPKRKTWSSIDPLKGIQILCEFQLYSAIKKESFPPVTGWLIDLSWSHNKNLKVFHKTFEVTLNGHWYTLALASHLSYYWGLSKLHQWCQSVWPVGCGLRWSHIRPCDNVLHISLHTSQSHYQQLDWILNFFFCCCYVDCFEPVAG